MNAFRVFLAYAHEDKPLANKVVAVLKKLEFQPFFDEDIPPGMPFTEAIKGMITHVHVFMPLLTENAKARPWVHQETGYALALGIPVLPLAVGTYPGEMASQLQAVTIKDDIADIEHQLRAANIERLVLPPPGPQPIFEVVDWPERRAEAMARYADRVAGLGERGRVRQHAALSSFCIPDEELDHDAWKQREGEKPRTSYYRFLQREERRSWEQHARDSGCTLILFPSVVRSRIDPTALEARVEVLLQFLNSPSVKDLQVVVSPRGIGGNLAMIGDWFVAESLTPRPGEGYRQSTFTSHAPTVLRRLRRFDEQFERLCKEAGVEPNQSREKAIDQLRSDFPASK